MTCNQTKPACFRRYTSYQQECTSKVYKALCKLRISGGSLQEVYKVLLTRHSQTWLTSWLLWVNKFAWSVNQHVHCPSFWSATHCSETILWCSHVLFVSVMYKSHRHPLELLCHKLLPSSAVCWFRVQLFMIHEIFPCDISISIPISICENLCIRWYDNYYIFSVMFWLLQVYYF